MSRQTKASQYLPESIYEFLPHVYFACGLLVLLVVGNNGYSIFSAALLFAVGFIVLSMRHAHRGNHPVRKKSQEARHLHVRHG